MTTLGARLRDLPISRKLMLANVSVTAIALLLLTAAYVAYDLVTFRQAMVRKVMTQAELIGSNAAAALLFDDRDAAAKTLSALQLDPHVKAAAIYTRGGGAFASYRRLDVGEAPALDAPGPSSLRWHRFDPGELIVAEDIVVDEDAVGTVRIAYDLVEWNIRLRSYLALLALAAVAAILVAALLSSRLQRTISGPILHLVDRARIVSEEKNYAIRATPEADDELGLLVRTFNEMLAQIQRRDTELERARDAAEEANRAKDEFLSVVSHELRTPLTPIIAWTRLLRDRLAADPDGVRALDVVERNARAQAELIDDLLDVSRIVAGKVRLDVHQIDLRPVVEAAVESLMPAAEARGIRVQTVLDPRAGLVAGDAQRLQQVVWNLLSNAIKFTPKGGRVQVHLQRINSHVEVAVSDTGQGIHPDFLPHVFDRFRQADSSTTRVHGGLGLGLAIVRHIVELHGGKVRAASPGEGRGATFTVELPVSLLRTAPSPVERVHPTARTPVDFRSEPTLQGLRVLVVDDEPDTLDTVQAILAACGADVRTVASAQDALAEVQRWRPDMLLSDIGMPEEDGFSLIRKLRALPPEAGGRTPALALTAYARVEDRVKVLSAGFQMHVPKPVEPAELVAVVASLRAWRGAV